MLTRIRLSRTRFARVRRFSTVLIALVALVSSGLVLASVTPGLAAGNIGQRLESTVNKLIERFAPQSRQAPVATASQKAAPAAPTVAYTVNSLADTNTGAGTSGTLRYCITQANVAGGTNTITFSVTGTITLTSSLPTINNSLTIDGPGPSLLTISGNNSVRVVSVNNGLTVVFQDLTIANGYANGTQGGAIDVNASTVTLQNCVFDHNRATFDGGAVRNNGGNMTVTNCLFSNNISDEPSGQGGGLKQNGLSLNVTGTTFINNSADAGGGLHVGTGTTNTSLTNCTFYANTATFGGAVEARAAATFQNCTFYRNVASSVGGINAIVQATTLINTIVSGNLDPNGGPSDIEKGGTGTFNTAGSFNNLIGAPGSSGFTNGINGNLVGILDPKLVPAGNYGGPVPTVPIRPSSQARNAGRNTGAPATDARGFNRPQASTVDIGAFELQTNSVVTNTLNSGAGSLRDVLTVVPAFEIVQFESPLFDSPQTISLSSGQIAISQNQAIVGPDASLLTITDTAAASSTSRAFLINPGVKAILGDMKLANNHVTTEGGAISNGGTLTVRTSVVDNNTSVNEGGGIANGANTTLTVIDSTISNNTTSSLSGGGIGSYGAMTVTGSTFVGNSASFNGGGIAILNGGGLNGSLAATNSTFSANQAAVAGGGISFDTTMSNTLTNCTLTLNQQINAGSSGGGINVLAGTVTLKNTIIANNTKTGGVQSDITGTVAAASSFNLIGTGGSGGLTNGVNSNQVGVADAKLTALGSYGGPTQTHLLSINSPAGNAGTSSGAPTTDQRGVKRSLGGTYDIGAVEAYITVTPATVPTGTVGTTYAGQTFSTSGGSGDFTFDLIGTLPAGMFFSPIGADISGTPTQSGSFSFIVVATDNTNGIAGASSYTLTINPQVLHHFAIANISSPQTAGTAFNITVTAQDSSNNTVLGFNGTVNLSTTAGTITPTISNAFTNGVLTQNVTVTQSGTLKTVTVNDGGGHTGTSNNFTVNAGALDHFAIANISSSQTSGTAFNITITAQDLNNNTVTSFVSTVGLTTTAGTISPTTSGAFASGVRTQSVTVTQAGTGKTITVTRTAGTETGTSNTFTVNAGALHHFAIGNISTQTAGTAFNATLTAQDASNNTVTSFASTVNLTTTAGTITPTTSGAFSAGTLTQSVTVTQAGAGKTITVDDGASHTGTSNTFTVNSGALHHFAIGNISTQTAGTAFNITLTAQDLNNNTVTGFTGTVGLSTTAGTITPTTSGAFASGVRTESVTVTQAGSGKTITADDGGGHTGTSNAFTVNPGALHHFATGNISSPQTAGTAFNITITAQDSNNNTVTSFASTVNLTTTAGTISPTTSGAFASGTRTQSVTLTQAGTSQTISVDDGSGHTGTSNTFTVNAGALHHFAVGNISSPQTAGTAFNIALTAQDLNNNTVTSFTGTVGLTTTAGAIAPSTSGVFTSGARTESVTVTQAGTGKTITANDGAGHTATSNTFTVNPGALHHFAIGNIGSQATDVAFNIALTAQDLNNNTVTGFTGTVNLSTTAGTITPTTSGAFTGGTRTQSVTVSQAGTGRTISVDDGSGHTGTSNGFTVIASNTPPTITAQTGISRQQGSPASNSTIATVSDAEQAVNALTATVTSANPSNGVTISNIVNTNGTITADIVASCTATNASFTLQVSDGSLTNTASLAVSVTANAAPTLVYGNASAIAGGSTSNIPTTATDNGSITSYAVQSQGTYTGTISVNSSGVVSLSSAAPAGNHTITIRATDNCGTTTDATFTLNVGCPATVVTNGSDSGSGSLRQIIADACAGSTITFQAGVTTVTLTTAELPLNKNLTIDGSAGVTVTRSAAGGTPNFRIFNIATGTTATLNNLTITNGNHLTQAGGIQNSGTLTINNCTVTGNTSGQSGGLQNDNVMTVSNSIVSNNIGLVGGGGGISSYGSLLTITGSTIANNTSAFGGGVYSGGTLTVSNSTFSGNSSVNSGGAIDISVFANTDSTITNSTFSGNMAETGGAISLGKAAVMTNCTLTLNRASIAGGGINYAGVSPALLRNTIVSGNTNADGTQPSDIAPNLVDPSSTSNLIGVTGVLLAPLGNYGGTTQTHALLPGSPAINAGATSGAPTTDQRGIARVGNVDIGAFESRGFTLAIAGGNSQSAAAGSAFALPLSVTVTSANSEPVNGGQVTFTPPVSGASASIAGNPATISGGAATSGTVTANGVIGGPYTVMSTANGATPVINFSLTNTNSAPAFTPAAAISRQQGSPAGAAVTVGTVSDAQTAAGSLTVTQIAGGTASGITVTGITNSNGNITAVVSAACGAVGGTVRFQVTDGNLTGTGDLTVNVTANSAPTLTYGNASVNAGASTTNNPTAVTDNGSINSYAVQSAGTYTGTISVNSSGVVSISNAAPVGAHTITIRATDNCGATTDATFTLTVSNNAPTITAGAALSRQQGMAGSVSTIATVSDGETAAGSLVVTATTVPTGITVTTITNTAGTITATVAASCTATLGANTVVLTVTDGNSGTATANLTVNVTANTAPTLTYAAAAVNAGASTTNSPTAATDNGSITGYSVQSQGTYTGTISVNTSGVVTFSNAVPVGSHTITIRATDNCGATTDASFTLTVGNNLPTITPAAALTRQQGTAGSTATIATVNDNDTPLGNLVVTATTVPAGITVTAIANANGTITANIAAACNATVGANTVVLTVTDANNGSSTGSLTVNVTANAAPGLTYPASDVAMNTATTITPTTATDNGSIASYSIVSVTPPLITAPTVNAAGGVSINNAGPFGSHTIVVRATDNCGATTDATFTLNIGCGTITVSPATLINGLTFVPYSSTLSANGGSGTYTFSLASGTLPAGLTLNGNNISGTPNTAGASTFTIRATDDNGCFGEQTYTLLIGSTGLMYYPLARPVRLLDTRPGASANACFQPNAPIPGGTARLQPARGTCEGLTIPPTATTITGNITTVQSGGGFLAIYPSDAPQPLVANSNYLPNEIINNSFTVGVGAVDGAVKISVTTNTDVVIDVTGYYAPPATGGLYFHPLPRPVRLLETRAGYTGCYAPAAPLPGGVNTVQQGTGSCAGLTIPSEALALVGNATTVNPVALGYLTLYPANAAQPLIASSNYNAGQIVNGPFTVGLAPSGQFKIFSQQTTDLVIDITGYYSAQMNDVNGQGLLYSSLGSPLRLLDTRAGQQGCYTPGAAMTGGTIYPQETQSPCTNLTPTARALIGNATVVNTTGLGYLTFWPGDAQQPLVATSNYTAGQVINRYFTVGLATDGSFKRFASSTTELVVDISGFFAP